MAGFGATANCVLADPFPSRAVLIDIHAAKTAAKGGNGADDKRLQQAQKDLEKARADYEASLKGRSNTTATGAELSPTVSKEEARAAKKQAEQDKRAAAAAEHAAKAEQKAAAQETERAIKADQQAAKHAAAHPAKVDAQQTAHADTKSGNGADDKRLQKAQKDLEKARADYEAALKRRADESTAPAAPPQR